MENIGIDLNKHYCMTSENEVSKIVSPLVEVFGIKHFRYLKLYNNGSRIILSNHADCIRFIYGEGHYKKMWFDGGFTENLIPGWHVWDMLRAIYSNGEISSFEKEIKHSLSLSHGLTYVSEGDDFKEIYTFDTDNPGIYHIDKELFLRFMFYFKENAVKLIQHAENEKIIIPQQKKAIESHQLPVDKDVTHFVNKTSINRYYLNGKYRNVYLTQKEVQCLYWLLKGKTAEEIALIDGNRKRTIECHFENVKRKLDCIKQSQVIKIIIDAGILNTFTHF